MADDRQGRETRLAAALRANLRRRKAQAQGKAQAGAQAEADTQVGGKAPARDGRTEPVDAALGTGREDER